MVAIRHSLAGNQRAGNRGGSHRNSAAALLRRQGYRAAARRGRVAGQWRQVAVDRRRRRIGNRHRRRRRHRHRLQRLDRREDRLRLVERRVQPVSGVVALAGRDAAVGALDRGHDRQARPFLGQIVSEGFGADLAPHQLHEAAAVHQRDRQVVLEGWRHDFPAGQLEAALEAVERRGDVLVAGDRRRGFPAAGPAAGRHLAPSEGANFVEGLVGQDPLVVLAEVGVVSGPAALMQADQAEQPDHRLAHVPGCHWQISEHRRR